jgi:hypothetical protein
MRAPNDGDENSTNARKPNSPLNSSSQVKHGVRPPSLWSSSLNSWPFSHQHILRQQQPDLGLGARNCTSFPGWSRPWLRDALRQQRRRPRSLNPQAHPQEEGQDSCWHREAADQEEDQRHSRKAGRGCSDQQARSEREGHREAVPLHGPSRRYVPASVTCT